MSKSYFLAGFAKLSKRQMLAGLAVILAVVVGVFSQNSGLFKGAATFDKPEFEILSGNCSIDQDYLLAVKVNPNNDKLRVDAFPREVSSQTPVELFKGKDDVYRAVLSLRGFMQADGKTANVNFGIFVVNADGVKDYKKTGSIIVNVGKDNFGKCNTDLLPSYSTEPQVMIHLVNKDYDNQPDSKPVRSIGFEPNKGQEYFPASDLPAGFKLNQSTGEITYVKKEVDGVFSLNKFSRFERVEDSDPSDFIDDSSVVLNIPTFREFVAYLTGDNFDEFGFPGVLQLDKFNILAVNKNNVIQAGLSEVNLDEEDIRRTDLYIASVPVPTRPLGEDGAVNWFYDYSNVNVDVKLGEGFSTKPVNLADASNWNRKVAHKKFVQKMEEVGFAVWPELPEGVEFNRRTGEITGSVKEVWAKDHLVLRIARGRRLDKDGISDNKSSYFEVIGYSVVRLNAGFENVSKPVVTVEPGEMDIDQYLLAGNVKAEAGILEVQYAIDGFVLAKETFDRNNNSGQNLNEFGYIDDYDFSLRVPNDLINFESGSRIDISVLDQNRQLVTYFRNIKDGKEEDFVSGTTVPVEPVRPIQRTAEINRDSVNLSKDLVTSTTTDISSLTRRVNLNLTDAGRELLSEIFEGAFNDSDGDQVIDLKDNCPQVSNPNQADSDGDGIGNVCDTNGSRVDLVCNPNPAVQVDQDCLAPNADLDNDGIKNSVDNCLRVPNFDQDDEDSDGLGDVCDPDFDENAGEEDVDADDYKIVIPFLFGDDLRGTSIKVGSSMTVPFVITNVDLRSDLDPDLEAEDIYLNLAKIGPNEKLKSLRLVSNGNQFSVDILPVDRPACQPNSECEFFRSLKITGLVAGVNSFTIVANIDGQGDVVKTFTVTVEPAVTPSTTPKTDKDFIDVSYSQLDPLQALVTTKATSKRVILNLYKASNNERVITVDYHIDDNNALPANSYVCSVPRGCGGWAGEFRESEALRSGTEYYYVASLKVGDGATGKTYRAKSDNFVYRAAVVPPTVGVNNGAFVDVPTNHPNFLAIQYVRDLGIMVGSSQRTGQLEFRPNDVVLRTEAFAVVNRLSGERRSCSNYNPAVDRELGFVDLQQNLNRPDTHWFMTEIKCSLRSRIIQGYADGTVRPLAQIIDAEAVKVMLEASAAGRVLNAVLPFVDFNLNPWWLNYYEFLARNGVSYPLQSGAAFTTRGDFAQIIMDLGRRGLLNEDLIKRNTGVVR